MKIVKSDVIGQTVFLTDHFLRGGGEIPCLPTVFLGVFMQIFKIAERFYKHNLTFCFCIFFDFSFLLKFLQIASDILKRSISKINKQTEICILKTCF